MNDERNCCSRFMESLNLRSHMHWDHEPKTRKRLEIKGCVLRFMESTLEIDLRVRYSGCENSQNHEAQRIFAFSAFHAAWEGAEAGSSFRDSKNPAEVKCHTEDLR